MEMFYEGKWQTVALPSPVDPSWTVDEKNIYALVFLKMGGTSNAQMIAESFVYKSLHKGLQYSKEVERVITDLVERA